MALPQKKLAALTKLGKVPMEGDPELDPELLESVSGGEIQFVPDDWDDVSDLFKVERYFHGYCPYCYCDHELIQTKYVMSTSLGDKSMFFCRAAQKYFFTLGDTIYSSDGEPLSLNY
ncbi:MAG: hypothetical protein IK093_11305 [Ruminiclostridium sp.]|nr:hypothetical protein [Ruminiclostridium sp.]